MKSIEKTIKIDGRSFTLCEGKRYHYNTRLRKTLHQYLWEKENGPLPKGWEIHHKDLDTTNNDLSNLEAMPAEEHKAIHRELNKNNKVWLENKRKNLEKNARPKANEWHGSEAGREWHRKHYEEMKDKLHQTITITCECCGKECEVGLSTTNRFCSNKCKSKWRRDNGLDDEERVCGYCGKTYICNKYSKTRACSRSCGCKLGRKLARELREKNKQKDSPNLQE